MGPRGIKRFGTEEGGAVAATYALSLTALIAVAGIGFDYARLAGMDSELQNGADQAALAGATQLNKENGSCARATNAAIALLNNESLLANDKGERSVQINGGTTITVADDACTGTPGIVFYVDKNKATVATTDETAAFIEVSVDARVAEYAFTPIVGALNSGNIDASALAGVAAAVCKVPPLMICNPDEPSTNTNTLLEFNVPLHLGHGIKLVANDSYTPGAFGFLQTEFGSGANGLLAALAWDTRGGDCTSVTGVEIKDGMNASVMDGINTRFDLPGTGNSCPDINGVTGICSPSVNSRKDLVRQAGNCNWSENTATTAEASLNNYRPTSAATYDTIFGAGSSPQIIGHPRDLCHAVSNAGVCAGGRIGTGDWDIQAYWMSNYGAAYSGQIPANLAKFPRPKGYPSRYEVYRWEADRFADGTAATSEIIKAGQSSHSAYAQPQDTKCLATSASPYGLVPGDESDRRRLSVAVLNCNALIAKHGNSLNNKALDVGTWIDIFLVEPSFDRRYCTQGSGCGSVKITEKTDVYVEVIGETVLGGDNGATVQTVRKDVPYLVE